MKLLDTFHQLRIAYRAAGLEAPEAIHLKDSEQGARFSRQMRTEIEPAYQPAGAGETVVRIGGAEFWEAEVIGIKVRWPARRCALPGGGWTYV